MSGLCSGARALDMRIRFDLSESSGAVPVITGFSCSLVVFCKGPPCTRRIVSASVLSSSACDGRLGAGGGATTASCGDLEGASACGAATAHSVPSGEPGGQGPDVAL